MSKTIPLTRQYPKDWCHRTRIWSPHGDMPGHFSTQFEGYMDPDLGDLIRQLFLNERHVDGPMMEQIRSMAKEIRDRARREQEVREVMES